uniref:Uncharacterized protein n=1 Tax=Anser cygnoides TaxID=8845 RepID=A0A8B9D337_ANSCY
FARSCSFATYACSTRDTSARGTSGTQPTDTYRRYRWHRNDAGNRPPPQPYSDRGPGPSRQCNSGVEPRREHQEDSCGEQRRAHGPEPSVGPRHGCKTDGSLEPMRENQPDSGMGPRGATG